jgi:CheY-like chemotaxis protein
MRSKITEAIMSSRADVHSLPTLPAPSAVQPADASSASPVVLVVDDDPDCRLLIRDAITDTQPGATVCEVSNTADALRFLNHAGPFADAPRPALIYLDVEMPGATGIELVAQIKADPSFSDIPVVMMTGVCEEQYIRAAAAGGANSYTIKPADAAEFFETVAQSTRYWLTVHQLPGRHLPPARCRR